MINYYSIGVSPQALLVLIFFLSPEKTNTSTEGEHNAISEVEDFGNEKGHDITLVQKANNFND